MKVSVQPKQPSSRLDRRVQRGLNWVAWVALFGSGLVLSTPVLAKIASPVATTVPSHYDLTLTEGSFTAAGQTVPQIAINGGFPGPNLVLRQGQAVTITVNNRLTRASSIHWHGLLVPPAMDGAPGFNRYKAIAAGGTFTYSFTPRQSGTYWYHSHTGLQEQEGLYGAITILPPSADPTSPLVNRDLVAVISDRFAVPAEQGLANSIMNAAAMGGMKASSDSNPNDPHAGHAMESPNDLDSGLLAMTRDLADAQGLEFLVNGEPAHQPQSFIYKDGERLRLRIINAAGNSIFDLWVQGLPMTIVAVDGVAVKPVTVDEFRFMPGQTYDILVTPTAGLVYPLIADSIDRSGRAVAVITPQEGLDYSLPPPREKTLLSDADFSDQFVEKMGWTPTPSAKGAKSPMAGMEGMEGMEGMDSMAGMEGMEGMDSMAGMDDMGTMAGMTEMGDTSTADFKSALKLTGNKGWSFADTPSGKQSLDESQLRAQNPASDLRQPTRTITLNLNGNMTSYQWGIGDYDLSHDLKIGYKERVRIVFVNDTNMPHPMHLHGLFMAYEAAYDPNKPTDTGSKIDPLLPLRHTVSVPPGKSVSVIVTGTEVGEWPLHCHLLFHMDRGMITRLTVTPPRS